MRVVTWSIANSTPTTKFISTAYVTYTDNFVNTNKASNNKCRWQNSNFAITIKCFNFYNKTKEKTQHILDI